MLKEKFKNYSAAITTIAVFVVYLFTLAPSVIQIDAGELAAVQYSLGIAHPTGYPLFTILGYLFLKIPMPFSKIFQANLFAAIFTSLAVWLFIKTARIILQNVVDVIKQKQQTKKKKQIEVIIGEKKVYNEIIIIWASILAGLVLAFSKTFWFQSTSIEVYSLHLFLINLIIYFLIKAYFSVEQQNRKFINNSWFLMAVSLALGFTNHLTTILMLPGIAYLFFCKERFNENSFKKIGKMILIFIPVLVIIYLYLPLRAASNPILNWGNPIDFERFIRHLTGAQYQVWLFSSFESAGKQLSYFIDNLPLEFAYIGLLFFIVGIIFAFKRLKRIAIFLLISFIITVLYSINYDINDIDSYFLLAYISLAFFSVFCFAELIKYFISKRLSFRIRPIYFLSIPIFMLIFNFSKVNQGNLYIFEDYTKSILTDVKKDALILTYQWDYLVSPAYYFQFVENYRRDVCIIDKELLRRSWYYLQLQNNYPDVLDEIKSETHAFLNAVKPFERNENFDPNLLENIYRRIMTNLIVTNIDERECYIAPELVQNEMRLGEFTLPEGFYLVPEGMLYKVVRENKYYEYKFPEHKIRNSGHINMYVEQLSNMIPMMYFNRALYEIQYNNIVEAKRYIEKIQNEYPEYRINPEILKLVSQ